MRNTEERLGRMHERAHEIRKRADKTILKVTGSISAGLMACLILILQQVQKMHPVIINGKSAGSSLLSDSAGAYVLIAVIAFMAGVIITAVIYKSRRKR